MPAKKKVGTENSRIFRVPQKKPSRRVEPCSLPFCDGVVFLYARSKHRGAIAYSSRALRHRPIDHHPHLARKFLDRKRLLNKLAASVKTVLIRHDLIGITRHV